MKKETVDINWVRLLVVVVLAFGLSRALFLSVFMGGHYFNLANDNMVKRVSLPAARGVITDVNGKYLAMNSEVDGKTVRFYPMGEMTASIVGYLSKADSNDIRTCGALCDVTAEVGRSGLEKTYEDRLRGVAGEVIVEESASGEERKEVSRQESVFGENIKTNIDLELQKRLFIALKGALGSSGKSASGVVARVSGEVLSLVSLPSFDPNLFVVDGKRSDFGGDYKDVASLLKDTEKMPLFNRVVSGEFAPGSVYKLVPALAGLGENKIDKNTIIADTGEIVIGEYRFGNWFLDKYGKIEGDLDVEKALSRSNDVFFYRLGEKLGVDALVSWSQKLGLGKPTGIDLPSEVGGFVPTPYWREKTTGAKWFLGNTYHMSIGQGDLMASPVQINRLTSSVVSGLVCKPRVVGKEPCLDLKIEKNDIDVVMEGMKLACSKGGTAFPLFDYEGKIYCKTGTAQQGGKESLPHAWISVVVPKGSNVRDWIVVSVLIEAGGEGSAVAGPVVKEIMPYLLSI